MDDLDEDEPVDDIENPEVFTCMTFSLSYCQIFSPCCCYVCV